MAPTVSIASSARLTCPARTSSASWLFVAGVLLFAWLGLWNKLRVDWTINDQYNYGWFVPPICLALLAIRWPTRPPPLPDSRLAGWGIALAVIFGLFLLLPIRLVEEPNPDWRLLYWLHASVLFLVSAALSVWLGGWPWLRFFAFPLAFLFLAIPWPSGPEQAIVQSLMRIVAHISAEGMNVLGIPAVAQGNLIHVRSETLGVDEACSGIRSLQTTIMGGLLLGELSRLPWRRRLLLLVGGVAIALLANVFRSGLLVWITARHGSAAMERAHDFAGVSVLLIVFAGLVGLSSLLGQKNPVAPAVPNEGGEVAAAPDAPARAVPQTFLWLALACLLLVEGLTAAWYTVLAPHRPLLPRWTVQPPVDAPGFQLNKIDYRSRQLLRYDEGVSSRWKRSDPLPSECTLFFFRWEPGHASAAQANMHQPHICLTASGLTQLADWGIQPLPLPDGITLPVRRYEFAFQGHSIYVFFVVWQDGAEATSQAGNEPGTYWKRLAPVLEHRANTGRQTLEFIVSGPKTAQEADARFRTEIAHLVQLVPL